MNALFIKPFNDEKDVTLLQKDVDGIFIIIGTEVADKFKCVC